MKETKNKKAVMNLTASAVCLALCMLLPFLSGNNPQLGSILGLMHIPVFLCGFAAGPFYAAMTGFIAPLLRFLLFQSPPFAPLPYLPVPPGIAMMFELSVYGLAAGLLYNKLPKKPLYLYVALIAAMLTGRLVWGASMLIISPMYNSAFTWAAFTAGAFITAIPGIILHIAVIPLIVMALQKARIIGDR